MKHIFSKPDLHRLPGRKSALLRLCKSPAPFRRIRHAACQMLREADLILQPPRQMECSIQIIPHIGPSLEVKTPPRVSGLFIFHKLLLHPFLLLPLFLHFLNPGQDPACIGRLRMRLVIYLQLFEEIGSAPPGDPVVKNLLFHETAVCQSILYVILCEELIHALSFFLRTSFIEEIGRPGIVLMKFSQKLPVADSRLLSQLRQVYQGGFSQFAIQKLLPAVGGIVQIQMIPEDPVCLFRQIRMLEETGDQPDRSGMAL